MAAFEPDRTLPESSITYGHATHRGLKRTENQDAYGKFPRDSVETTHPKGHLFIVADGMGGHQGGREASQMAVHIIEEEFFSDPSMNIPDSLLRAFNAANKEIYKRAASDPSLRGMGTTSTALVIIGQTAYFAHIGDSRAYRVTEDRFEQITQDHSQVEELVRRNILTREQAERHPQRNVLSRAMGVQEEIEVDFFNNIEIHPGEHFLLCSDGLARVPKETIQQVILSHHPQEACDQLVQLANEHGGHDNVTVQVVRIDKLPTRSSVPRSKTALVVGLFVLLTALMFVFFLFWPFA